MGCEQIPLLGGGSMIICSRGGRRMNTKPVCSVPDCERLAGFLCDWKLGGRKAGKTCDAKICEVHALRVTDDKELCPAHAKAWDAHPRNPKNQEADRGSIPA